MRILVVGSGGREHALAWRLCQGHDSCKVFAAPGNPGIASIARCLPCAPTDIAGLMAAADEFNIDLTVVGPEAPLAAGIVDAFRARGLPIFGPTAAAAELETSKVFAKRLMRRHGIPTAAFEVCTTPEEAIAYVRRLGRPVVVKADGLASGKGVVVADDPAEAERAIVDLMVHRVYGAAGDRVVIEDRLEGDEVSVLALVSHGRVALLPLAQDYKRLCDADRGPNTGGMGAVAPARVPAAALARVVEEILQPTVHAMQEEGRPYTGVLYAGVMVTPDGPNVLEFNCRLGDPEAQVILPLLVGELASILHQTLRTPPSALATHDATATCVVLASRGYPGSPETGQPIYGLDDLPASITVFHAGTAVRDDTLVTAGGRVLNVVSTGRNPSEAATQAYAAVDRIHFPGMHYRTDIGRERTPAPLAGVPELGSVLVGGSPSEGQSRHP